MTDLNTIAQNYITAWNETDAARRAGLARGDLHRQTSATAIRSCRATVTTASLQLIDGVQQRFAGFRFTLKGQPDGFGDHIRFSWEAGTGRHDVRRRRHRHRHHRG